MGRLMRVVSEADRVRNISARAGRAGVGPGLIATVIAGGALALGAVGCANGGDNPGVIGAVDDESASAGRKGSNNGGAAAGSGDKDNGQDDGGGAASGGRAGAADDESGNKAGAAGTSGAAGDTSAPDDDAGGASGASGMDESPSDGDAGGGTAGAGTAGAADAGLNQVAVPEGCEQASATSVEFNVTTQVSSVDCVHLTPPSWWTDQAARGVKLQLAQENATELPLVWFLVGDGCDAAAQASFEANASWPTVTLSGLDTSCEIFIQLQDDSPRDVALFCNNI